MSTLQEGIFNYVCLFCVPVAIYLVGNFAADFRVATSWKNTTNFMTIWHFDTNETAYELVNP